VQVPGPSDRHLLLLGRWKNEAEGGGYGKTPPERLFGVRWNVHHRYGDRTEGKREGSERRLSFLPIDKIMKVIIGQNVSSKQGYSWQRSVDVRIEQAEDEPEEGEE
jgi:hypothetical protein